MFPVVILAAEGISILAVLADRDEKVQDELIKGDISILAVLADRDPLPSISGTRH